MMHKTLFIIVVFVQNSFAQSLAGFSSRDAYTAHYQAMTPQELKKTLDKDIAFVDGLLHFSADFSLYRSFLTELSNAAGDKPEWNPAIPYDMMLKERNLPEYFRDLSQKLSLRSVMPEKGKPAVLRIKNNYVSTDFPGKIIRENRPNYKILKALFHQPGKRIFAGSLD